jgi:hypothetical protein
MIAVQIDISDLARLLRVPALKLFSEDLCERVGNVAEHVFRDNAAAFPGKCNSARCARDHASASSRKDWNPARWDLQLAPGTIFEALAPRKEATDRARENVALTAAALESAGNVDLDDFLDRLVRALGHVRCRSIRGRAGGVRRDDIGRALLDDQGASELF